MIIIFLNVDWKGWAFKENADENRWAASEDHCVFTGIATNWH